MSQKILITGGTGLVGTALSKSLHQAGNEVWHLSRRKNDTSAFKTFIWDPAHDQLDAQALKADVVIHLAGSSVAAGRWTQKVKDEIYNSRIDSTRLLVNAILQLPKKDRPRHFISASAIGIYGADTGNAWLKETDEPGGDFLAGVVYDWEKQCQPLVEEEILLTQVRIGVVLSTDGGALPRIISPIKMGLGAALGSGRQYMSWIHIADLVALFSHIIHRRIQGTYNAVAPVPVTNAALTKAAATILKKPLILPNVPGIALRLAFGEMAQVVLGGNRVSADKIKATGFDFQFPQVENALADLLK